MTLIKRHYKDILPEKTLYNKYSFAKQKFQEYSVQPNAPNQIEADFKPIAENFLSTIYSKIEDTGDTFENYLGVDYICNDNIYLDLKVCQYLDNTKVLIDVYKHNYDNWLPAYNFKYNDNFLFVNKDYYILLARDAWKQIIDSKPELINSTGFMVKDKFRTTKKAIVDLDNYFSIRYIKKPRNYYELQNIFNQDLR